MTGAARWEVVVGIEVHVQLRTGRKLFCPDAAVFGDEPNSHVCPVCLGLPGALPTLDEAAVRLGVRTALALDCRVNRRSIWARKNYFYPDLPKGYQITQFEEPLASGGELTFDGEGGDTTVRINRIHMEEDAGKSIHDRVPGATAVDLNRAGTPLVEIVTEPDLRSPEDVRAFLTALKHVLEYVDVSDCNMEEGSLRADANVSIRPVGESVLGTKTEIKNVNSFSGIERALHQEIERQITVRESGGEIESATLLWDDHRGTLRTMRSKEESHDYRYFPDPDLPPLLLDEAMISAERAGLPELPRARRRRFTESFSLAPYDAGVLSQTRAGGDYFEAVAALVDDAKSAANWVMGPVQAALNTKGWAIEDFPVPAAGLAELLRLVADGTISDGVAKSVLDVMVNEGGAASRIVAAQGLQQVTDQGTLGAWVDEVITECAEEAERYRGGEQKVIGFLVGQVMRKSGGKADPRQVNELLRERLA